MASSIFLPSVPQLADDLNTSETIINVTIAIFIVIIGVAPIIWSPLSGFYGRKPVYLASMPITIAGSIGVALSRNVGDIIGTRVLQGIGSSAVLAVGAGTIGDIFRPTERANAMGWFYSGVSRCFSLKMTILTSGSTRSGLGSSNCRYIYPIHRSLSQSSSHTHPLT
jgi:MFS family permease